MERLTFTGKNFGEVTAFAGPERVILRYSGDHRSTNGGLTHTTSMTLMTLGTIETWSHIELHAGDVIDKAEDDALFLDTSRRPWKH